MTIQGNDERMIAYLLGELTEAETILIEEQYMADDEALAQLMAVEAELYDAYASHSLSPERTRRFENKFLATSEQRSRLEFSRALLRQPRPGPTRTHETSGLGCCNIRGVDPCFCSDLEILAGSAKLNSHATGSGLTFSCCRSLRYWRRQYTKCFRRIGAAPFRYSRRCAYYYRIGTRVSSAISSQTQHSRRNGDLEERSGSTHRTAG